MARVDEEQLNTALEMFNAGLARNAQAARAKQAVDKAEKRKQEAATSLKKIQDRQSATPEERAEAEAAYRTAVEEFNRLRAGGEPASDDSSPSEEDTADESADTDVEATAGAAPESAEEAGPEAQPEAAPAPEPAEEAGPEAQPEAAGAPETAPEA